MLPLGSGRFMHLVVLYGYPEQLALTEQLFDVALGELSVVAREQLAVIVGDFNVEPTKIPCLAKGISAGLWVELEKARALAAGLRPAATCKRDWTANAGHGRDFNVGCPRVTKPLLCTTLWPASWLSAVDQGRGSKSVEVQRDWEVYDERLQYMSRQDAFQLDESLASGDISRAWLVWSGAAEAALADAYRFSGGSYSFSWIGSWAWSCSISSCATW